MKSRSSGEDLRLKSLASNPRRGSAYRTGSYSSPDRRKASQRLKTPCCSAVKSENPRRNSGRSLKYLQTSLPISTTALSRERQGHWSSNSQFVICEVIQRLNSAAAAWRSFNVRSREAFTYSCRPGRPAASNPPSSGWPPAAQSAAIPECFEDFFLQMTHVLITGINTPAQAGLQALLPGVSRLLQHLETAMRVRNHTAVCVHPFSLPKASLQHRSKIEMLLSQGTDTDRA